jgi:hypothetical protein
MCWRPDVSTVFRVKRNFGLFEPAMDLAREIFGMEKPKKHLSCPQVSTISSMI